MPTTSMPSSSLKALRTTPGAEPAMSSMKYIFTAAFHHGIIYGVAILLGKLANVFLLPVYTRYLTTTDYGVMELLDLTCAVVVCLLGIPLTNSMLRYYSDASTSSDRSITL